MQKSAITVTILALLTVPSSIDAASHQSTQKSGMSGKEVALLEAGASTPADHLRIAAWYRERAAHYENEVQYHEEMAALYRVHPLPYDGKLPYTAQMQPHCRYWADDAQRKADQALAKALAQEESAANLAYH